MKTIKKHLPKGFLSSYDEPTFNAVEMFFYYLLSLPQGWNQKKLNMESVKCVQEHFKVDHGFGVMIKWGNSTWGL